MKELTNLKNLLCLKVYFKLIFLLLISANSFAQNVYVSTGGNNSNSGTITSPWKTIQYAVDHVGPGQIIYVRSGVYPEKVKFSGSGDSGASGGAYVTLQTYSGETAVLDGSTLSPVDREGMVSILNASYIKIIGFEIRNFNISNNASTPVGIYVEGASHHLEIRDNKIHDIVSTGSNGGAHGVGVFGTNASTAIHTVTIDNNEIYDCTLRWSEAMVLNGNVRDFVVSNNSVHDCDNIAYDFIGFENECGACGTSDPNNLDQARDGEVYSNIAYNIDTKDNPVYNNDRSAAGFYVDGGKNIIFDGNISHHNNLGFELASEHSGKATSGITVRNNFVYLNHVLGITTGGYAKNKGDADNCIVVNNTFYHNNSSTRSRDDWGAEILLQSNNHNNIYKNNIIYADANRPRVIEDNSSNTGNVYDYNVYYGSTEGMAPGSHSITADPLLVNPNSGDLHISEASPAINAGENLGLEVIGDVDIDGQTRIFSSVVDCGADESGSTGQTAPVAPSNNTATAISSSKINLSWIDNSDNEDNFIIERSLSGTSNWSQIASLTAESTTYSNTGLSSNTTYYYRVKAVNSAGSSNWSNTANATTNEEAIIPSAPSSLLATAISSSKINLSWADNSDNEDNFIIERSLNGTSNWTQITSLTAESTTYSNTGLSSNTTYYYRVKAVNATGSSNWSNTANATTNEEATIPSAPSSLLATAVSASKIDLSWNDNSSNEDDFEIQRSLTGSSGWLQIAIVNANVISYSDEGLTENTTYHYRVRARNVSGNSDWSPTVNASTLANSGSWVNISSDNFESGWGIWNDGGSDARRYSGRYAHQGSYCLAIQDNTNSSVITTDALNLSAYTKIKIEFWFKAISMDNPNEDFWLQISTNGGSSYTTVRTWAEDTDFENKVFYSETEEVDWLNLTNNTKIRFRCDASGNADDVYIDEIVISAYTNTPPTAPDSPDGFTADALSSSEIDLSWNDNSNNEDDFEIQRSLTGTGSWSQIAVVGSNSTSYANTGLDENTTYFYRIRARNGIGNSNWSANANATTQEGTTTTITVDGNTSDWGGIGAIATASGQNISSMKVYHDNTKLYVLLQGSGIANHTEVFINSDNNAATGYQAPVWTSSGADYMIEDGELYKSTANGTGWNWSYKGTTGIDFVKNSSVVELSIEKSKINPNSVITIGAADLNNSWNIISRIPSSGAMPTYTLNGGMLKSTTTRNDNGFFNDTKNKALLLKAYPNPFKKFTKVSYELTKQSNVSITVFDIKGNIVAKSFAANKNVGLHEYNLDAAYLVPGVYTISVKTTEYNRIIKVLMVQ